MSVEKSPKRSLMPIRTELYTDAGWVSLRSTSTIARIANDVCMVARCAVWDAILEMMKCRRMWHIRKLFTPFTYLIRAAPAGVPLARVARVAPEDTESA